MNDYELTKKVLGEVETDKLQNRFDLFKEGLDDITNKNHNENTGGSGIIGGGGGGDNCTLPRIRPPPSDWYGGNTPAENSRCITQANEERFKNRRKMEREREISNISRGIVKYRRSTMDINFRDIPPPTP